VGPKTKDMIDSMSMAVGGMSNNTVVEGTMDVLKLKEAMLKMPKKMSFPSLYGSKFHEQNIEEKKTIAAWPPYPGKVVSPEKPLKILKPKPGGYSLKFESKIVHETVAPKFGIATGADGNITATPLRQSEKPMTPREKDFERLNK